jgi:hypothetical protein
MLSVFITLARRGAVSLAAAATLRRWFRFE